MMPRCAICEVVSASQLCHGCQALIVPIDNPCQSCAKPIPDEQTLCGQCRQQPPPFSHTFCTTIYQSPVSLWVHELKFANRMDRAAVLAEAMAPMLAHVPLNVPLIPVPLHRQRLRHRGYNQAHEIARLIAKQQVRPLLSDVLLRRKNTAMQAELSEQERTANVRNAFAVNRSLAEPRVLLLDDVMTTGQTMQAASRCLLQAGVGRVDAVVFARSG
jgi:ComF family protein